MGLYSWMAKVGLRGLRRKAEATGRSGPLNSSWDIVTGGQKFLDDQDRWPELTDSERLGAYRVHAMVFSCVRLICASYHTAPIEIGTWKKKTFKTIEKHPVLDLLYYPNPHMSYAEFMEYHIANLLLTGKAFVWEFRNRLKGVTEIWPVPSSWVKVVPLGDKAAAASAQARGDDHRFISHYEVQAPGTHKVSVVPVQDMTYVRFIDPTNFIEGIGPLQACWRNLRLDLDRENYLADMLDNLKVPGMIIKQEEEFSEAEREALREVLSQRVGGRNRGMPLTLWGKGAGVEMVAPLADMDWPGMSAMTESHISAAFGVPPILVHARVAQENSPLSSPNLEAAEQLFFRTTMTSLWMHSAAALTRGLVHNEGYDRSLELRHDLTEIKALQEDLTKTAQVVEAGIRSGVMQINEGRERLGLEPDPELEGAYLLPMGMTVYRPAEDKEEDLTVSEGDESNPWDDGEENESDSDLNGEAEETNEEEKE